MPAAAPPLLDPRRPPPPDYYAGNLRVLVAEVRQRSGELLDARELRHLEAFEGLGAEAQRLLARLLSRRGPCYRIDSLNYAEITQPGQALQALTAAGLVSVTPPVPADTLLRLLTRAEQQALFPAVRGARKAEWMAACLGRYPDRRIRDCIARRHPWVAVSARHTFALCQLLFFGGADGDLSTFVVQDLGIRRFERYQIDRRTRPFRCRAELDRFLACQRLRAWTRELDDAPCLAPLITSLLGAAPLSRIEQRARNRLLNRVGYWHERRGEVEQALGCYRSSDAHPARERQVRILHRQGHAVAARTLLEAMRREPWAAEEEEFAGRFPGRRAPLTTRVSEWVLPAATPARIERYAAQQLTSNGGRAWHVENLLPLGLAGLCFWDEVFAPVEGAFSNPFQLAPHDLLWPDFSERRRHRLAARRAELLAPGATFEQLRATLAAKRGIANRLVHWGLWRTDLVETLARSVDERRLLDIALYTLHNLNRARTGFPDLLLVYGPGAYELVEVKGPNDQLQPAQRIWLEALRKLAMPVRVLRLRQSC